MFEPDKLPAERSPGAWQEACSGHPERIARFAMRWALIAEYRFGQNPNDIHVAIGAAFREVQAEQATAYTAEEQGAAREIIKKAWTAPIEFGVWCMFNPAK